MHNYTKRNVNTVIHIHKVTSFIKYIEMLASITGEPKLIST